MLRFWESPEVVVVLGNSSRLEQEVHTDACRRDRIPIFRRASGGGTVLLGPGCLNFTLMLSMRDRPELLNVPWSYAWILGSLRQSIDFPGLEVIGSDLVLSGRKISGSAQKRTRHVLLHHGTILYNFDLDLISRYLREPERQPEYRQRRPHSEFVGNLPLTREEIRKRLAQSLAGSVSGA